MSPRSSRPPGITHPPACMVLLLSLTACATNPYLDMGLDSAKLEGKDKTWFEEQWGKPDAKTARLFGGEVWMYSRIAGARSGALKLYTAPTRCLITLKFDKDEKLVSSSYSGC